MNKCVEKRGSPVKVILAVDLALFVEALFVQLFPADLTADTGWMPVLVQDFEQKPVLDGPKAACALHSSHPASKTLLLPAPPCILLVNPTLEHSFSTLSLIKTDKPLGNHRCRLIFPPIFSIEFYS